jgi:hypothetical protein
MLPFTCLLSQLVLRPAVVPRKCICLMAVSPHLITDDGNGRREHEDSEASCHIDARHCRNDGEWDHRGRPEQQWCSPYPRAIL